MFAYEGAALPSDPLPDDFHVAILVGSLVTVVVGVGLMALVFYSSRHGYDEPPKIVQRPLMGETRRADRSMRVRNKR